MFIGNIDASGSTTHGAYPEAIQRALEYLCANDFKNMEDGTYPIEGEKMFAKVQRYETRLLESCRPETHQKYVDIQYVVEGEEYLGWCPFSPDLRLAAPYDDKLDVAFYEELIPESNLVLLPGSFAVLYPEDVHRPCGAVDNEPSPVTKVVVKVSVDLL